jgi:putative oxidoreductase
MDTTFPATAQTPTRSTPSPLARLLRTATWTDGSYTQTLLRWTLGAILLPHGAQHALGLFGGYGFSGTLGWMTGSLGFPAPLAATAIVVELVAPLLLLAGAGGRAAGLLLAIFMVGAASTHVGNGFFMNWFGGLPAGSEGFEYHLWPIAVGLAVAARGSGALSVDAWRARR